MNIKFERWEWELICDALDQALDEWTGDDADAAARLLAKIKENIEELVS